MAGLIALLNLTFRGGMKVAEQVNNVKLKNESVNVIPGTNIEYWRDSRGNMRRMSDNVKIFYSSHCPMKVEDIYGNVLYDEKAEKEKAYEKKVREMNAENIGNGSSVYAVRNTRISDWEVFPAEKATWKQIVRLEAHTERNKYYKYYFYDPAAQRCSGAALKCCMKVRWNEYHEEGKVEITKEEYDRLSKDILELKDVYIVNEYRRY